MPSTDDAVDRVRRALLEHGLTTEVRELDASTRTAADAAAALGCDVAQIVKSLVFRGVSTDRPVLVLTSGAHRADPPLLTDVVGEPIAQADADFVRDRCGFVLGGVAPVGHLEVPTAVVDEDLLAYEILWAAGGSPSAVFPLSPEELVRLTSGRAARIA